MLGTQILYLKSIVQVFPKQVPTPQKHDIDGFSVAWNSSIVCRDWLLAAAMYMRGVGMCAVYEDMMKGYLPSQNAIHRQPGFMVILAGEQVYTPVYRVGFSLDYCQPMQGWRDYCLPGHNTCTAFVLSMAVVVIQRTSDSAL